MKNSKVIHFSIIILLGFSGLINTACKNTPTIVCYHEEIIETGKNYYKPLIESLEKYKTDNGKYPEKLSQLTPKYTSPQVITDEDTYNSGDLPSEIELRFEALNPDQNSYVIKFDFRSKEGCYLSKSGECRFYSDTKSWNCE